MFQKAILAIFVICIGLTSGFYAQDAAQKTQDLIAALDKTKYKKKEKRSISIEIYIDVKNEPVVKNNIADYGGHYEDESAMYRLTLHAAADGSVTGDGYDTLNESARMKFTLKDARINGALLTGTKVYENGKTEPFEAVFTNRTISSGKNVNEIATRDTKFGLGFIQRFNSQDNSSNWTNRVFLEFKN